MTEEHLTPVFEEGQKKNNTVALVWMIFSIIWLLLFISIFWIFFSIPLLVIGLILWIIGLFFSPRGKAIAAVILSIIPLGLLSFGIFYVVNGIKAPLEDFAAWAEENINEEDFKDYDKERFNATADVVFQNLAETYKEKDFEAMFNTASGSNVIEKWAYLFFDFVKEGFAQTIDAYNAGIEIEPLDSSLIWGSIGSIVDLSFDITTWDNEGLTDDVVIEDDTACIEIYQPVCWIDGNVYWNSCFLEKAGVELDESSTATEEGCVSE